MYEPEWYSHELLCAAHNLVQTINPDKFLDTKEYRYVRIVVDAIGVLSVLARSDFVRPAWIVLMYATCGVGGTLLAKMSADRFKNAFARRKNLEAERDNIMQIIALLK